MYAPCTASRTVRTVHQQRAKVETLRSRSCAAALRWDGKSSYGTRQFVHSHDDNEAPAELVPCKVSTTDNRPRQDMRGVPSSCSSNHLALILLGGKSRVVSNLPCKAPKHRVGAALVAQPIY